LPGRASQTNQLAAITKVIQAGPYATALREHVRHIVNSPAFNGSDRSREFLLFIVDKALAGQFEDLKERVLGVELFGRNASYDTSDDAIVRVTASDVRRRLLRYYSEAGAKSEFRIEIPVGSYIPEFQRVAEPVIPELQVAARVLTPVAVVPAVRTSYRPPRAALWGLAGFLIGLAVWGLGSKVIATRANLRQQPWATILNPEHGLRIVMSDTELITMQNLLDYNLSLSDYANQKYVPNNITMSDDLRRVVQTYRGVTTGTAGVAISLNIARLAFAGNQQVSVVPARGMQLRDFKTDENFVLIGSPRSNPWVNLLQDSLDLQFLYDSVLHQEFIVNKRPKPGEPARYLPSARGGATGQAYGIIAFLANPGQNGHILFLAGSSSEATEAAAKLALNETQLRQTLQAAGLKGRDFRPFEILLRVETMAGSATTWQVAALHLL